MLASEFLTYYRWVSQQMLTVVDVETTGKYASHDRIIELSVLQATLEEGILHQQTSLINPPKPIPAKISRLTGISQAMVETAPAAADVLPDYLPWLQSGLLTAHNVQFDYPFLQVEFRRCGTAFIRAEAEQLCTVQLSRLMLPDLPSRSLPHLVQHFQFPVGASHRAEADTLACWMLARHLLSLIRDEPDEVVLGWFGRQWIPVREAAKLLGCMPGVVRSRLADAETRRAGRTGEGTWMYRRMDVERVFYEDQQNHEEPKESQLSLL
jgi:DNA polymerase III subunit epsilon